MTVATAVKFNFKTRTVKDDDGKVLKTYAKQPSVTADLPFLTAEELIAVLSNASEENAKVRALVVDAVNEEIKAQAKVQFDGFIDDNLDNETFQISANLLDHDRLTLEYIASIPPAQRGARGISDEEWTVFFNDYLAVMPQVTGKDVKRITYHLDFLKKPQRLRQEPEALSTMIDQLNIYLTASQMVEETGEAANRVKSRFEKWLKDQSKVDLSAF